MPRVFLVLVRGRSGEDSIFRDISIATVPVYMLQKHTQKRLEGAGGSMIDWQKISPGFHQGRI